MFWLLELHFTIWWDFWAEQRPHKCHVGVKIALRKFLLTYYFRDRRLQPFWQEFSLFWRIIFQKQPNMRNLWRNFAKNNSAIWQSWRTGPGFRPGWPEKRAQMFEENQNFHINSEKFHGILLKLFKLFAEKILWRNISKFGFVVFSITSIIYWIT